MNKQETEFGPSFHVLGTAHLFSFNLGTDVIGTCGKAVCQSIDFFLSEFFGPAPPHLFYGHYVGVLCMRKCARKRGGLSLQSGVPAPSQALTMLSGSCCHAHSTVVIVPSTVELLHTEPILLWLLQLLLLHTAKLQYFYALSLFYCSSTHKCAANIAAFQQIFCSSPMFFLLQPPNIHNNISEMYCFFLSFIKLLYQFISENTVPLLLHILLCNVYCIVVYYSIQFKVNVKIVCATYMLPSKTAPTVQYPSLQRYNIYSVYLIYQYIIYTPMLLFLFYYAGLQQIRCLIFLPILIS